MAGWTRALTPSARFRAEDAAGRIVTDVDCADESPPGHRIAVEFLFNWLEQRASAVPVLAVGHHVVDGGPRSRVPPGSTRPRFNTCGRSLRWRQHGSVRASW